MLKKKKKIVAEKSLYNWLRHKWGHNMNQQFIDRINALFDVFMRW